MKLKKNKPSKVIVKPEHLDLYPWQWEAMRTIGGAQYIAMVVARQSGKSALLLALALDWLVNYDRFPYPRAMICGKTSESIFANLFQRLHNKISHLPIEVYQKAGTKSGVIHTNIYRPHIGDWAQIVWSGVGNVSAFRGTTLDLALLDEYSLYPKDAWNAIIRPATKIRGAKAIFTGTPEGRNNPLFRETSLCKKEAARGNKQYACVHLNAYQAAVMSDEEIEIERRAYESSGENHLFHQEVMARFDAIDTGIAPFNQHVMDLEDGHADMTKVDKRLNNDKTMLNVTCDIGAAGACATFFWVRSPIDNRPIVLAYEDKFNGLKSLVNYCMKVYGDYTHIRLVLPVDANQPSLEEGNTRAYVISEHIQKNGWASKMDIHVLPKVKDKLQLFQQGIQQFSTLKWDRDGHGIMDALVKLSQVKFRQDPKTGWVDFGKVVKSGDEHAADALLYIIADINNTEKQQVQQMKQLAGLGTINISQPKYPTDTPMKYNVNRRYRW